MYIYNISGDVKNGGKKAAAKEAKEGKEGKDGKDKKEVKGSTSVGRPERCRPAIVLSHAKCTATVRSVALSPRGNYCIYCCEDSTIWVWSINSTV